MQTIALIIESGKDGQTWGSVQYDHNLIVDQAPDLAALQTQMKRLLQEFHDLQPEAVTFDLRYEVAGFFETVKSVRATEVAKYAHISPALIRQYSSGKKVPSPERAKAIEDAIHQIGRDLLQISIATADSTTRRMNRAKTNP